MSNTVNAKTLATAKHIATAALTTYKALSKKKKDLEALQVEVAELEEAMSLFEMPLKRKYGLGLFDLGEYRVDTVVGSNGKPSRRTSFVITYVAPEEDNLLSNVESDDTITEDAPAEDEAEDAVEESQYTNTETEDESDVEEDSDEGAENPADDLDFE